MAGLSGKTILDTYKSLLRVDDNNGIVSVVKITDGAGVNSPIAMGPNRISIIPTTAEGTVFEIDKSTGGGENVFRVNTNTPYVTALGNYVNTH